MSSAHLTLHMSSTPPTSTPNLPLDLQTDVAALYFGLQSRSSHVFLTAAKNLLIIISPSNLPAPEFRKNSRKIIRLIETARETLQASGILLHLFTSCSARRQERKEVYFDLLRMLKERRDDVDPALQARMNALLVRLSSNFRVRRLGVQQEPSSSAGDWMVTCCTQPPGLPRAPAPVVNSRTSSLAPTITTRPPDAAPSKPSPFPGSETSASICSTMPPPDAFVTNPEGKRTYTYACRALELASTKRRRHRSRSRSTSAALAEDEESDSEPSPRSTARAQTPPPYISGSQYPSAVATESSPPPRFARKHARTRDPCPALLAQLQLEEQVEEELNNRHRQKRKADAYDQENRVPNAEDIDGDAADLRYKLKCPPLTRRFGIFCTSKGSMHQAAAAARSATRSAC